MKKILVFISIISIACVLASCGNKETSTEPKPKTCEQIEPCKTALKYATYVEQGAADKVYDMDTKQKGVRSYSSLEVAKDYIPSDYKQYQHQKIEKYGLLEYDVVPGKQYIYKFRFEDFRTGDLKNLTIGISKQKNKYLTNTYVGGALKSDVTNNGIIAKHKKYYSTGLTQQEKDVLSPDPIEK
ncbi:hypothetical protein [Priestia megaterium]|uniref:hypothetical protein n=1 Tax=Priestia megaterium TaxID=1404 RepID=UPI0034D781CD